MPTLDDLRSALGHLAEQAAPGCEEATAERIRHRRARRRATTAAVAVAVVAALAMTVAPLIATHRAKTPVAGRADPALISALVPTGYVFDVVPGAGYVAYDAFTSATSQAMTVYSPAGRFLRRGRCLQSGRACAAAAHRRHGCRDQRRRRLLRHAEDGHRLPPGRRDVPGALAWQYQPGAWALVYGIITEEPLEPPVTMLTAEQARQVAGWVRLGQYHAATVPARISGFPGDLVIKGILHRRMIGSADPGRRDAVFSLGPRSSATFTMSIGVTAASADTCTQFAEPVTIGGYTGSYVETTDSLTVCDERTRIGIDASFALDQGVPVPLDQLKDLVLSITPAPRLDDPRTWFDATTAIS